MQAQLRPTRQARFKVVQFSERDLAVILLGYLLGSALYLRNGEFLGVSVGFMVATSYYFLTHLESVTVADGRFTYFSPLRRVQFDLNRVASYDVDSVSAFARERGAIETLYFTFTDSSTATIKLRNFRPEALSRLDRFLLEGQRGAQAGRGWGASPEDAPAP